MQFVCDGPNGTWFRIETEGEASKESQLMSHAVEKYFLQAAVEAEKTFVPPASKWAFEQKIRLKSHVQKVMPIFVTLRDREGAGLATAMLPPAGEDETSFRPIVVGQRTPIRIRSTARTSRYWPGTMASHWIPRAATPTDAGKSRGVA